LLEFYRGFEPLGAAQGLPPFREHCRRAWIDGLLVKGHNLGAFARNRLIGHITLQPSRSGSAEVAYFVDSKHRRKGLGTCLLQAAIAIARSEGYQRVWASVGAANAASIKMLRHCGFSRVRGRFPELEMELTLAPRSSVSQTPYYREARTAALAS